MRRVGPPIAMTILFMTSLFVPIFSPSHPDAVNDSIEDEFSSTQFFSTEVHFSPSLEYWTEQEVATPMILTRNLVALHEWQIQHGLLPKQSEGATLVDVEPSSGILEHRSVSMPGWMVAKLPNIQGVFAVFDASDMPQSTATSSPTPSSVRSGEIHGATDAWSRGYQGDGVRVAVTDSGIDFAHPDLNGTQAVLDDSSSPYDGWGIMHDPVSLQHWLRDGNAYPDSSASWWVDSSSVDNDSNNDSILDGQGWNISGIQTSISGVYHYGIHSDSRLINRAGGDVNILVVDTIIAGVYDTVYMDIDRDDEFGDESPVNQSNPTYGRDTNGDGLWDQSAGLLWWISDGTHGVPYGDVYAARLGYSNRIAGSGDLLLLMINDASEAGGNHGTLCASAVAAQGIVSNGKVLGMAPESELISVANFYGGGSYLDSMRFIAEGYDGNASTSHDQGQIGSFSFGWSNAHDDGADYWSLYVDWLTRVHSPQTTYFVAVGNGGHGYGTTASPGGAQGVMSVGAFSSKSGESNGGTWGESVSWSNRGPNSVSRLDPDIVAVGWSATGDTTLNEKTNANSATTTWGGTSLATPIAAGLGAIIYQAWYNQHGTWPDSQTFRDLAMSTADDRGYDPLVQGAGWMNVSRAVAAIEGDNGTLLASPGSWMSGFNEGAHRDANLNFMLPGQNQTTTLTLENPGQTNLSVELRPIELQPVVHYQMTWNSTNQAGNNSTWDGYQSAYPDFVFPLHIKGDANLSLPPEVSVIRARAVVEGIGFDGNMNYQSENRLYLRIWRWTDSDGDGMWWNDSDGDGYVDAGDWTEAGSEFAKISEFVYDGPQVEARVGNPHDWDGDGLLVGLYRDEKRTSHADPIEIQFDWTAFGPANDSWVTVPNQVIVPAGSTTLVNVSIDVPNHADGGIKQHGISIHSTEMIANGSQHDWVWPIITNVAWSGPFTANALPVDGNVSNQTLYEETWLQGAQRWGWRPESGDWKFLTIDWPMSLSGNGSIVIDVDWPDNDFTDVDVHWMSEIGHPFYQDAPNEYGPRSMSIETSSIDMVQGWSGVYGHHTFTGSSHEMIIAEDTPGTKQMMLHSANHGVNTNDNPLNITVGYVSPLGSGLETTLHDWTQLNGTVSTNIGSTLPLNISSITAHGFTIPQYLSNEVVSQDDPDDVQTSSYIREFIAEENELIELEIGGHQSCVDVDLYLYRDKNGNGILDWGNEREEASQNFNCDEKISFLGGQSGMYWAVVHGYDLKASNTSFWLRWLEIGGDQLSPTGWNGLNESEIHAGWGNGSLALGGSIPTSVTEVNLTWNRPESEGIWRGWVDIELDNGGIIRLPYTFNLIDPPPDVSFSLPNGTRTNQTLDISMEVFDYGTGFNISEMDFEMNQQYSIPSDSTFEVLDLDGTTSIGNISQWNHWNENRIYSSGDHYVTDNGSITLEAESAMSSAIGEGPQWVQRNTTSNYTGTGYMESISDTGFDSGDQTNGASLSWEVEFDSPGNWWIWAHVQTSGQFGDAIHVGIDGNLSTGGGHGLNTSDTGWTWANGVVNDTLNWRAYLSVPNAGRHTVTIWMKEDGVMLNSLHLTTNQLWLPPQTTPLPLGILWEDTSLRAAWLNWTLPADNQWHEYSAQALDLTNRIGASSLLIEYDDISPPIVIHDWDDFVNQSRFQNAWIETDPEAEFWLNGTQLTVDSNGRVNLDLHLTPTIWGMGADSSMWDTSTWEWHNLNNFTMIARDPAGNWNHATRSIVYDPWAPSNVGPTPQLVFDGISVPLWGDTVVPVTLTQPYNFDNGSLIVSRLFDGHDICITILNSSGVQRMNECQIDLAPPWEGISGRNHPLLETNQFELNISDWPDDIYEIHLEVTDWADNTGELIQSIKIDRTNPSIQIHTPTPNEILTNHHLLVNWSVSESTFQFIEINGEERWNSQSWMNGTQNLTIELARTGNHTICIIAWDQAGIQGVNSPNIGQSCHDIVLPEETYWPTLIAPWNGTHVSTPAVSANVFLGPDQSYKWWHTASGLNNVNGTMYPLTNGTTEVPINLVEGENHIIFQLEALEKIFVYELFVTLDTHSPILSVAGPINGTATYRDGITVYGDCEPLLQVVIDVDGIMTEDDCRPDGSYEIWAELPNPEGKWLMTTSQTDLAGNSMQDVRSVIVDRTAPSATLRWIMIDCDREPTAPVWSTAGLADCMAQIEFSPLSDDIVAMQLNVQSGDSQILEHSLGGNDLQEPVIFNASGSAGIWTIYVLMEDAAGNKQLIESTETFVAPEATLTERLSTIGTMENIATILVILILILLYNSRSKNTVNDNPWTDLEIEKIEQSSQEYIETEFDFGEGEGLESTHNESTSSNTDP
ncbi:MAG: S8 family serine peptidase [Candidatus Thermoplasmatota archaeon]|nr:S8 family serine peptidase [Candidatus Thermoplasmatota archaeon]